MEWVGGGFETLHEALRCGVFENGIISIENESAKPRWDIIGIEGRNAWARIFANVGCRFLEGLHGV